MNFTNFDLDQVFGMGQETNPLLMLVWILPVIIFVLYGQRIQLYVTSNEIKKAIRKLDGFKIETHDELFKYMRAALNPETDPTVTITKFLDYFTMMPVDMDPAGIVAKVKHTVRLREDYTRQHIRSLAPQMDDSELSRAQTLIEIVSSLQMIHKTVNHMFLTAKKQNNYPLIVPLQMALPFIMEQAESMKDAIPAFRLGQPVGDGIGPMVVGRMMLRCAKEDIVPHTVLARDEFEGRRLLLLKARGPAPAVGRPADALRTIIESGQPVHAIIMVDAALKMEGEDSASVAHGFGAAIGGIGTERFEIEEIALEKKIPILSIVIKESVREAITLMTKDIADSADGVRRQVYDMIRENTEAGQVVLVIGVGNTVGVSQ